MKSINDTVSVVSTLRFKAASVSSDADACSPGALAKLSIPTTHGMSNRNVVVRARPQPLSLRMLAHVVRYCEKHDEPMHPGIVRWASASLTTDYKPLVQADSKMANGLFWSK